MNALAARGWTVWSGDWGQRRTTGREGYLGFVIVCSPNNSRSSPQSTHWRQPCRAVSPFSFAHSCWPSSESRPRPAPIPAPRLKLRKDHLPTNTDKDLELPRAHDGQPPWQPLHRPPPLASTRTKMAQSGHDNLISRAMAMAVLQDIPMARHTGGPAAKIASTAMSLQHTQSPVSPA